MVKVGVEKVEAMAAAMAVAMAAAMAAAERAVAVKASP